MKNEFIENMHVATVGQSFNRYISFKNTVAKPYNQPLVHDLHIKNIFSTPLSFPLYSFTENLKKKYVNYTIRDSCNRLKMGSVHCIRQGGPIQTCLSNNGHFLSHSIIQLLSFSSFNNVYFVEWHETLRLFFNNRVNQVPFPRCDIFLKGHLTRALH